MLKLISMAFTCCGFMLSGILIWEAQWTAALYCLTATWLWFGIPKLPSLLLHGLEKLWARRKRVPAQEA